MRVEDECPGGASDPRQNKSDEQANSMTGRCLGAGGRSPVVESGESRFGRGRPATSEAELDSRFVSDERAYRLTQRTAKPWHDGRSRAEMCRVRTHVSTWTRGCGDLSRAAS